MYKTLKTKRLTLKSIGYDDVDFMYHHFKDDFVNTYLYDAEPVTSKEEAKEIIDFYIQTSKLKNHRYILINEDNIKIGTIGFHSYVEEDNAIAVGYDLQEAFTHKGYMREALQKVIDFIITELNIDHIDAVIYPKNHASIKLIKHFGFTPFKRKTEWFRNQAYEHDVYRLISDK